MFLLCTVSALKREVPEIALKRTFKKQMEVGSRQGNEKKEDTIHFYSVLKEKSYSYPIWFSFSSLTDLD